jgi:MFS family permease
LIKNPAILFACEMFSGFIWGGFNLCAVNFIFDAASPQSRVRHLSYFNLVNGIATFLGAAAGGFLASHLPPLWGSSFYLLCILSFLLRFMSWSFLSSKFHEVRTPTHRMTSAELFFSVLGIKPALEEKQIS